jgi:hypothetical protein
MSSSADSGRRRIAQSLGMTYIISTNSPGDEATFRKVGELVESKPDGLVALYAGASGDGLSITAIWETKAQSDRIAAEQLGPALQQLGVGSGGPRAMIHFEAFADVAAGQRS